MIPTFVVLVSSTVFSFLLDWEVSDPLMIMEIIDQRGVLHLRVVDSETV